MLRISTAEELSLLECQSFRSPMCFTWATAFLCALRELDQLVCGRSEACGAVHVWCVGGIHEGFMEGGIRGGRIRVRV